MTLSNHFFQAPLCKASFEYFCGWLLIILGYCFVISIVFANPAKMNYGSRKLNHELSRKRPDIEFDENIYSDLIPNHIVKFKERDKEKLIKEQQKQISSLCSHSSS